MELIARKKIKAKKKDFISNPEASSLIHYAAWFNNLELFKECVLKGQSAQLENFWKEAPICYALRGHSFEVLNYLITEYKLDLKSMTDSYGYPLWWQACEKTGIFSDAENKSLRSYSEMDYLKMYSFLKSQNIDFNQRNTTSYKENLACRLLQGYKHKQLYFLLKERLVDVNQLARLDMKKTLAHCGSWMEDSRFIAFKKDSSYVEDCYSMIYQQCDPTLVDENEDTVLDRLCKSGRNIQVKLFCEARKTSPNTQQKLWLRCSGSSVRCDDFKEVSNEHTIAPMIFFKSMKVGNLIYCEKKALISGLNDKEISKNECISLKDLQSMELITLPNGTELFKPKEVA